MKVSQVSRVVALLVLSGFMCSVQAGKPGSSSGGTTTGFSLYQPMDSHDSSKWYIAGDWSLSSPFISAVCQSQTAFSKSMLNLKLESKSCVGKPYAAGQYQTSAVYKYGRYEARLKAAKGAGVVTGFFTYTGESDNNPHHEIDVEILGKDTTKMQANYYVDGVGGHEKVISLGFDASAALHTYAFDWQADSIKWYVDGKLVHTVTSASGPLPSVAGKIMANIWACDATSWCGTYVPGTYTSSFDWIGYR